MNETCGTGDRTATRLLPGFREEQRMSGRRFCRTGKDCVPWNREAGCQNPGCEEGNEPKFRSRLTEFNVYPTFSYAGSLAATYTEFEFASISEFGRIEAENRMVMNVADLPGEIFLGAANPGPDSTTPGRSSGFGDVLNGTFFSLKGHSRNYHLGIGPIFTFPTASEDNLGSQKWTVGPGVHFSTEFERLTLGFFLWQSWSFAGDSKAKRVNQMFGKPFFIYKMTPKWHLVYIPLGMSVSWNKKGNNVTVPVGGGLRRLCKIGKQTVGIQTQAFSYVARKSTDPEWELRFTIEFLFDE